MAQPSHLISPSQGPRLCLEHTSESLFRLQGREGKFLVGSIRRRGRGEPGWCWEKTDQKELVVITPNGFKKILQCGKAAGVSADDTNGAMSDGRA